MDESKPTFDCAKVATDSWKEKAKRDSKEEESEVGGRVQVPLTLYLLIYFWDTLLHSTEFLAVAFQFAFGMWNKKKSFIFQPK